jgi:hypothetical protein
MPPTDINHSPILVTGAHRTGTTWVGKMLAASGEAGYISEPLNVLHRPGVLSAPVQRWYTYICAENEAEFLPGLRQTLAFQYHPWAEVRSLRSRKDVLRMGRDWNIFLRGRLSRQRPLLKDPFAVFSAPWFAERLDCRVVITVRHPAAFASSLKRLDWPFDFQDLLDQPLLMRDWLGPFEADMRRLLETPGDIVAQGSLLWRMVYAVVDQMRRSHPQFIVVRHEDLSIDPVAGYRKLYDALGLTFTPQAQEAIIAASSSENPKEVSSKTAFDVRVDSRANLQNWKRRLQPEELERIYELTQDVVGLYYPGEESEA